MATSNTPLTIADLYQQYAGRAPDPEGLAYWTQDFGDTIDPREVGVFQTAVAQARAQGTEPAAQPAFNPAQIANTSGMGAQGIGLNFSGQSLAPNYYGGADTSVAAANSNIDLSSAVGSNQTVGLGAPYTAPSSATRDQVLAAYANNPLAELNPSEEAINYWLGQGLGSFGSTVDAVRASDPGLAAAIDASRAASIDTGSTVGTTADTTGSVGTLTQVAGTDVGADNTAATTGATDSTGLNNTHVIALGDSTTFGYNAGNQLDTNMVSSAQTALGNNYTIDNLGVNSTTIGDLLTGAAGTGNNWQNTLASDAGVVVLNYGMNEAFRGEDPTTFAANLTKAVNDLKAVGKNVILQTPNVATGYDWAGGVSTYADVIRNVARSTGSALDDKYATTSGMGNIFDPATGDTIHPSSTAYAALGGNLANVISGLNKTNTDSIDLGGNTEEIANLYQEVLGRAPDDAGLRNWYQQFGSEVNQEERDAFKTSAQAELDSRIEGLYKDFLGRDADTEGLNYWKNQFGSSIDDTERDLFRRTAAADINKKFGVTDATSAPTTEGILSGFKYANDSGISEDKLKKTLGEDVFNTYKTGFADYAKTGIANALADDKLSFDEARAVVKLGRDYGYDSEGLANLTGQKKELFDTINTTYDDATNKIVDSVFGAEDVKTNDDKIIKALALQNKYGFTDEDLAKAADFTPEQMKGFLDPVRNFGTEINGLLANTDSTVSDTKKFIEEAKKNGAISKLYGDNLGNLDTKIAELEDRWKDYSGVDPLHAQRVFDQIGQQRAALGDKYYQGTFGDPMKMAATLAKKGIDTLADIGQKDKYETTQVDAVYTTSDGESVTKLDDGRFLLGRPYGDGQTEYVVIPADQVNTTYGRNEYVQEGDGGYNKFVPLTEEEQATVKDGKYEKLLGKVAYDKDTGKEIAGLDGTIESEKSGKSWNRKRNELNVGFTDSGMPVLYTTREKTGFGAALQQAMPLIAFALPFMLPGIGAGLSSLLPGAGVAASGATAAIAPSLLNQALTQGIISGSLGSLTGQDFGKSFLSGAINPVINTGIGSLLPKGLDANAARAITGAGSGVIKGALQGGDFEDLLGQGVLSGLTNYGLGEATKGLNLTPQQLNFATGIAAPLIQGQKVNPMNVISTLAQTGQQAQRARP